MNGADLEICLRIHLICMFEFISSGSMFRFGLFNVIFYWCDLFSFFCTATCILKRNLFVIFVSMLPWTVEYTALPSLALRSLFCWLDSPDEVPGSGLSSDEHYRRFSQDESCQKADVSMFFFSLRPKSCSHPTVHIVFRDSMFPIFKLLSPHIDPIGCVQDRRQAATQTRIAFTII